MRMKIRKKLMVWGAFLLMGIIIAGCAEESYFDSVVSVDDAASNSGEGKGLGSRAKANIGDALTDLLSNEENENEAAEGSGDGAYVEAGEPEDIGIGDGGMPASSYVTAPSE